jgi:peptidoglycan glycosyltransferase
VVAIEPQTGRVRVMASVAGFDPNRVPDDFAALNRADGQPLFNRATQSGYPPGSTFKVVTAAAALDSGQFTPESQLDGRSPIDISGVPLSNFSGEQFGRIDLTTALTHSVNTVWAQVGEKLGKEKLYEYMSRFGFNTRPSLDYPEQQLSRSGVFGDKGRRLLGTDDGVDIGRVAMGQERLKVTPLQMAMVASAVADDGVLMRPRLGQALIDPDGREKEIKPRELRRVMKEETASRLQQMMGNVVREGTGTAAALQGIEVGGKTGTAEVGGNVNQAWFIGFAPLDNPRIAVAVTVERTTGQGGTVAAPIAKLVMEDLLR